VFRKIAVAFVGLVALAVLVVLILAAMQPGDVHVERQASIAAEPRAVYERINDLRRFTEWSPWAKLDPAMKTSFDGPPAGVGASYSWSGDQNVGTGSLTIIESIPDSKVGMRLEFLEPFASTSQVQFTLSPSAEGTRVSWAMSGRNDFMAKLGSVFIDMEGMIGRDFENGLASLKALAERES
jgi:hypothetical protein